MGGGGGSMEAQPKRSEGREEGEGEREREGREDVPGRAWLLLGYLKRSARRVWLADRNPGGMDRGV